MNLFRLFGTKPAEEGIFRCGPPPPEAAARRLGEPKFIYMNYALYSYCGIGAQSAARGLHRSPIHKKLPGPWGGFGPQAPEEPDPLKTVELLQGRGTYYIL